MISDAEITAFEERLKQQAQAPAWDPEWKITKGLIDTVRVQHDKISVLQGNVGALNNAAILNVQSTMSAMQFGMSKEVAHSDVSREDAEKSAKRLIEAAQLAQQGATIADFAGKILFFVAKLVG